MSARPRPGLLFDVPAAASAAIPARTGWLAGQVDLPARVGWAGAALLIIRVEAGLWGVLDRNWLHLIELLIHARAASVIGWPAGHDLGQSRVALATLAVVRQKPVAG